MNAATQERDAATIPGAGDEGLHSPGDEPLWNESFYFDAISDDGSLGVYHRLGRLPNSGLAMVGTCVVRPGEPAIMLQTEAPLPTAEDPLQPVATELVRAEQHCERPLDLFRLSVEGTGAAHADHSAPLRGASGDPVEIGLELSWETDGLPYRWRHADRYEIPCRVRGNVRIGEQSFELQGAGQRDHSWGARDWWGSDWMWCALHLDDGSHAHGVSVPDHPNFGVGYVQGGGELVEATTVDSSETVNADGLVESGRIAISPTGSLPGFDVELEPLAHGALRLESSDGRLTHFPRAMCRLRAGDGRSGWGWVEWNRNQPGPSDQT